MMLFHVLLSSCVTLIMADYECICSTRNQTPVYGQLIDTSTQTIGFLTESECKQKLAAFSTLNYTAIAYAHKVGFVLNNDGIQNRNCQGDPSSLDTLTTSAMPPNTSGMQQTTTIILQPDTTTTVRMTSTSAPSSEATTSMPTPTSGQQFTTARPQPTTSVAQFTTAVPQSTTSMSTTTTKMFTTNAPFVPSAGPVAKDNLKLCSTNLINAAKRYGYAIGQYNQSCYQLRKTKLSFVDAESYCRSHGGHLFDVSNSYEQDYIMSFLAAHKFNDEVWMGLQDKGSEENFKWTSGERLTYTNWYPYRKDDIDNHNVEDCAVLIPFAPFNGQWDDLHCGIRSLLGGLIADKTHVHSYICQLGVHPESLNYPGGVVG